MAAEAGPSILLNQDAYKEWKRNKGSSKNKKGYKDWTKLPDEVKKRYLTESLNGNRYWLPEHDANELDQYLLEHQSVLSDVYKGKQLLRNVSTPADFIDWAFSGTRKDNQVDTAIVPNGGHIKEVQYNSFYKILLVQFAKSATLGDTCAFFNLPANVAALLLHLARTGQMGTNGRHQLGIEFWNLVRVRGTVHNTRYQFEYVPSDTIKAAHAAGQESISMSAGGRREGSKGTDTKYFYDDSGRRYQKDDKGNPIIRGRGRPKKSGESADAKTAQGAAAQEAHKAYVKRLASGELNDKEEDYVHTSSKNVLKYNREDLDIYFNYGSYNEHLGKVKGDKRSILQEAYNMFKSGKDTEDIKNKLYSTGIKFDTPDML